MTKAGRLGIAQRPSRCRAGPILSGLLPPVKSRAAQRTRDLTDHVAPRPRLGACGLAGVSGKKASVSPSLRSQGKPGMTKAGWLRIARRPSRCRAGPILSRLLPPLKSRAAQRTRDLTDHVAPRPRLGACGLAGVSGKKASVSPSLRSQGKPGMTKAGWLRIARRPSRCRAGPILSRLLPPLKSRAAQRTRDLTDHVAPRPRLGACGLAGVSVKKANVSPSLRSQGKPGVSGQSGRLRLDPSSV